MYQIIFLKPQLQEKVWGGSKLKSEFNLDIPSEHTGEAWVISAHYNGVSEVTFPQEFKGLGLDKLYETEPQLFSPHHPEPFPLLVKILDAKEDLSIQVHPNDSYAQEHEGPNELGKTECWYIISAEPGAYIILGHTAKNREEFRQKIENQEWQDLFIKVPVNTGDFFDVPAGTIHAIGGGTMILETQQSSDTTYRVYDYDRIDKAGHKRDLHIEQSIDVSLYPHQNSKNNKKQISNNGNQFIHLMTNEYFSVYKWNVENMLNIDLTSDYTLATVIQGQGSILINDEEYPISLADSFIIPYGIKSLMLVGNLEIIASNPVL